LDDKINEAFTPIANWWGAIVLHNFPGTSIPTIIFLLVGGALFFTVYFSFVNIRRIPLAIQTVTGKYDALEKHNTKGPADDPNKKRLHSK
jgi:AGCS family alanine or glycine:cation symporter